MCDIKETMKLPWNFKLSHGCKILAVSLLIFIKRTLWKVVTSLSVSSGGRFWCSLCLVGGGRVSVRR